MAFHKITNVLYCKISMVFVVKMFLCLAVYCFEIELWFQDDFDLHVNYVVQIVGYCTI